MLVLARSFVVLEGYIWGTRSIPGSRGVCCDQCEVEPDRLNFGCRLIMFRCGSAIGRESNICVAVLEQCRALPIEVNGYDFNKQNLEVVNCFDCFFFFLFFSEPSSSDPTW